MAESRAGAVDSYVFGDIELDLARRRVSRGENELAMGRLAFEILFVLAKSSPRVVTHDELAKNVWGTRRVVTPEALAQQVRRLRCALDDSAESPRYIEAIRGVGYRLIPLVSESMRSQSIGRDASPQQISGPRPRRVRNTYLAAGIVSIMLFVVTVLLVFNSNEQFDDANLVPTVLVLPFDNLSTASLAEYYSLGLFDEIRGRLNTVEGLRVMGRFSSLALAEEGADYRSLAASLGVTHVIEGSVVRVQDSIRISADLTQTSDGVVIWSNMFAGPVENVFDLHEDMARSVVDRLSLELAAPMSEDSFGTVSFQAYELYLQGMTIFRSDPVGHIEYMRQALSFDAGFAKAWVRIAYGWGELVRSAETEDQRLDALDNMTAAAVRAIQLASDRVEPYSALAWSLVPQRNWIAADDAMRIATGIQERNPPIGGDAYVNVVSFANYLQQIGRVEDSLEQILQIRELDPLDRELTGALQLMILGRYKEALAIESQRPSLRGLDFSPLLGVPFSEDHDKKIVAEAMRNQPGDAMREFAEVWQDRREAITYMRSVLASPEGIGRSALSYLSVFAGHYGEPELAVDLMREAYLGPGYAGFFLIWHHELSDARRTNAFKRFAEDIGFVEFWRESGSWGDFCRPLDEIDFHCF